MKFKNQIIRVAAIIVLSLFAAACTEDEKKKLQDFQQQWAI